MPETACAGETPRLIVTGPARALVGGQSRHLLLLEQLAGRIGWPITVVEIGRRPGEAGGVRRLLGRMLDDYRALWRTTRRARRAGHGPLVVHLNSSVQAASLLREFGFALVARAAGADRVVLQVHGSLLTARDDGRHLLRALARMVAASASALVVLDRAQALAIGGARSAAAHVVPNAVDVQPLPPASAHAGAAPARAGALRLLFIGRLVAEKGPLLCIDTLQALRDRGVDAHLTIVGDGPLSDTIASQVDARALRDVVTLLGPVAPGAVRALLASHSLLLFTPLGPEGLPYVLLESLEAATPVVATVTSDAVAALVNDAAGAIVRVEPNAADVADAVAALDADRSRLAVLAAQARSFATESLSLEARAPLWRAAWWP